MRMRFLDRWYYSPLFWELFFLDAITKLIAYGCLSERPLVLNRYCSLVLVENSGISWGLFAGYQGLEKFILTFFIGMVLVMMGKYTIDRQDMGYSVTGETLVLSGGFSNFTDRLVHDGSVIDFIRISYGSWHFPVFNIADIAITIGCCIIVYRFFFSEESE